MDQDPKSMGVLIESLLEKNKLKCRIDEIRVVEAFRRCMRRVSEHVGDVHSQGGVLYVKFLSSVLRQELIYRKHALIERINEDLGAELVRDIKFK